MAYLILGYSRTGIAVEKWCIENSINCYVFDDNQNIKLLSKKFFAENWSEIQRIVVSPGFRTLHNKHKIIAEGLEKKIEIISDLDLFYEVKKKKNAKIIGITGTNGKSTTAALIYHILSDLGKNCVLCGNFGTSPLVNLDADFYIVEVSSGQLEISNKIRFDISAIVNITPDHFDYHGSMENYINAKYKIANFSKKTIVSMDVFEIFKSKSFSLEGLEIIEKNLQNLVKNSTKLFGQHNIVNSAFAFEICRNLGFENAKILNAISNFEGLEHRMEIVKTDKKDIIFINDSKGTTPDSTFTALEALESYNVYLIVGGYKKSRKINFKFSSLKNVKSAFCIGSSENYFYKKFKEFNIPVKKCHNMKNALNYALEKIKSDNFEKTVLLLSPMCASFDQYKNYEERGRDFKDLVINLH